LSRVDFAQLIKVYSFPRESEHRYSQVEVVEAVPVHVMGLPEIERICTSHIERQNLSIRMGMRRMTRLTNGFSKKWENLHAAYSLWFAYYNFCRIHKTLRVTPAMEAGITEHVWRAEELFALVTFCVEMWKSSCNIGNQEILLFMWMGNSQVNRDAH
jgi:hypothetical protein